MNKNKIYSFFPGILDEQIATNLFFLTKNTLYIRANKSAKVLK